MDSIEKLMEKLDPIKGNLRDLLINNCTDRYISDDTDTPQIMYLFDATDLMFCFLSKQGQKFYNRLTDEYQTTKEIAEKVKYPTKDVSAILGKIHKSTGLIDKDISSPRRIKWKKRNLV